MSLFRKYLKWALVASILSANEAAAQQAVNGVVAQQSMLLGPFLGSVRYERLSLKYNATVKIISMKISDGISADIGTVVDISALRQQIKQVLSQFATEDMRNLSLGPLKAQIDIKDVKLRERGGKVFIWIEGSFRKINALNFTFQDLDPAFDIEIPVEFSVNKIDGFTILIGRPKTNIKQGLKELIDGIDNFTPGNLAEHIDNLIASQVERKVQLQLSFLQDYGVSLNSYRFYTDQKKLMLELIETVSAPASTLNALIDKVIAPPPPAPRVRETKNRI